MAVAAVGMLGAGPEGWILTSRYGLWLRNLRRAMQVSTARCRSWAFSDASQRYRCCGWGGAGRRCCIPCTASFARPPRHQPSAQGLAQAPPPWPVVWQSRVRLAQGQATPSPSRPLASARLRPPLTQAPPTLGQGSAPRRPTTPPVLPSRSLRTASADPWAQRSHSLLRALRGSWFLTRLATCTPFQNNAFLCTR